MNNYKYIVSLDEDINMTVPAGEWLLDNIYLIEKEYKDIKKKYAIFSLCKITCYK